MISVVILTLNEGCNLQRCLDSVSWSDDVVLIDSGSTDDTVDIARAAGARVLLRSFDTFACQRNHAMEAGEFRHAWVLHLDADETVTPALRDEMVAIATRPNPPFPVYRLPSRLIFMGQWLRHAGMYPAYQVRLGHKDALRFVDYGHGQRETQAPESVGTCTAALDHYNFSKGVNDWFSRHLRYARREAMQAIDETGSRLQLRHAWSRDPTMRRRTLKQLAYRMPLRPLLRFFYIYILKRGFLDGVAGFHYAAMISVYQYFIDLNERELRERA
ncbi:MAG: glycosyltransferase family 2 protein [Chloroflexota bacterium]|nr:glycosyltransferase family 2 protein [Chloroflexota bacterium]